MKAVTEEVAAAHVKYSYPGLFVTPGSRRFLPAVEIDCCPYGSGQKQSRGIGEGHVALGTTRFEVKVEPASPSVICKAGVFVICVEQPSDRCSYTDVKPMIHGGLQARGLSSWSWKAEEVSWHDRG